MHAATTRLRARPRAAASSGGSRGLAPERSVRRGCVPRACWAARRASLCLRSCGRSPASCGGQVMGTWAVSEHGDKRECLPGSLPRRGSPAGELGCPRIRSRLAGMNQNTTHMDSGGGHLSSDRVCRHPRIAGQRPLGNLHPRPPRADRRTLGGMGRRPGPSGGPAGKPSPSQRLLRSRREDRESDHGMLEAGAWSMLWPRAVLSQKPPGAPRRRALLSHMGLRRSVVCVGRVGTQRGAAMVARGGRPRYGPGLGAQRGCPGGAHEAALRLARKDLFREGSGLRTTGFVRKGEPRVARRPRRCRAPGSPRALEGSRPVPGFRPPDPLSPPTLAPLASLAPRPPARPPAHSRTARPQGLLSVPPLVLRLPRPCAALRTAAA